MVKSILVVPFKCIKQHANHLFTVNNGLRLCRLLLLFPQRLRGFKFVHLWKTRQQTPCQTSVKKQAVGLLKSKD